MPYTGYQVPSQKPEVDKKPSGIYGISPLEMFIRHIADISKTIQDIAPTLGSPPELGDRTQLLKAATCFGHRILKKNQVGTDQSAFSFLAISHSLKGSM